MPSSRAATTSGTVLIPTTVAPAEASNRASPRVSYVGPLTHAYVPSASAERCRPRSCAARNAARRKGRAYASESGTKRAAFGRDTGPRSGLSPVKSGSAMWSSMTTTGAELNGGEEVGRVGRLYEWERRRERVGWGCQMSGWTGSDKCVCRMNALVPTGTSGYNDPAAFVTTNSSVSTEERAEIGEEVRRTDHILHAKSCHESDGIHHRVERVAFIRMKLG
jgi:hypothetical protein